MLEDVITLVAHYPDDNYPNDDTVKVTMPSELYTPTSSDTTLNISGTSSLFYFIDNANGEEVFTSDGQAQFALPVDSCYSIIFVNIHVSSALLSDSNGDTLIFINAGEYGSDYETPKLFFNVSDTAVTPVSIQDRGHQQSQLISLEYFDVLGKRYPTNDYSRVQMVFTLKLDVIKTDMSK